MIPWKKWIEYGASTILGAILGAASALAPKGYLLVSAVTGCIAGRGIRTTRSILFASAMLLTYAIIPREINALASAGTIAAVFLICRAMRGS